MFINENSSLIPVVNANQAYNQTQWTTNNINNNVSHSPTKQYSVSSSDGDQNNHQAIGDQDLDNEEEDKNLDYDSIEEEPNNKDGVDSDHDAIYEAYNDNHHRIQQ